MKNILFILLVSLYSWSISATDLLPGNETVKGVIHQDTTSNSFRLMVDPIKEKVISFNLCNRDLTPAPQNLTGIYSFRFYHINKKEITLTVSFCSINEIGKEIWSVPTEVSISSSKGAYQENSLENLSSNMNFNLSKVSKIKITTTEVTFLDELEFYYFEKDKETFKPNMREMRKKLKAEKQKLKDQKSKEYNKIREAEYKDHF